MSQCVLDGAHWVFNGCIESGDLHNTDKDCSSFSHRGHGRKFRIHFFRDIMASKSSAITWNRYFTDYLSRFVAYRPVQSE